MTGPNAGRKGVAVQSGRLATKAVPHAVLGAVLAVALGCAGCDHFRVESFHGARILFSFAGARPTAPGHHVELWARESTGPTDQRLVRLMGRGRRADGTSCTAAEAESCPDNAYQITYAVGFTGSGPLFQLTDGCMIDALGNLQWSEEARTDLAPPACNCQPPGSLMRSLPSLPDLSNSSGRQGKTGALAVLRRIHQITDLAPSPLLVVSSYDDGSGARPSVDDRTIISPDHRLQKCCDYWCSSPFAYSGNAIQTTAPIHGSMYGTLEFQSVAPAQLLGGVSLSVDYALDDIVEFWVTDTTAPVVGLDSNQIDCAGHPSTCRGTTIVDGRLSKTENSGRGVRHFDLVPPAQGGPSGTAAVQIRLDEDPQQF